MRKQKIPNQLQNLTDEQLAEFHSWFPKFSYPQISAKLRERYGVVIGKAQLCRYHQRLDLTHELSTGASKPLTVSALVAIQNGDPLPAGAPSPDLLKLQCLRAAHRPNQSGADLLNLFRVFTYEERRDYAERRLNLQQRQEDFRERRLALRKSQSPPPNHNK